MRALGQIVLFFLFTVEGMAQSTGAEAAFCQQIETVLSHFVDSRVQADSLELTLELPVNWPQGPLSTPVVDWTRPDEALRGKVALPVRLTRPDGSQATVYARARIRTFDWICVAGRDLDRHHELSAVDIELSLEESTGLDGDFLRHPQDLAGWRLRRRVGSRRVLLSNMVETLPLVRQGDLVEVQLIRGNLLVSTQGVAKQDGWKGDLVRVRVPYDNQEMKGRVAGPRVVAMAR